MLTGDPITVSHEYELGEALRLYDINKDSELTIHGKYSLVSMLSINLSTHPQHIYCGPSGVYVSMYVEVLYCPGIMWRNE